jgi:hypothetical protein
MAKSASVMSAHGTRTNNLSRPTWRIQRSRYLVGPRSPNSIIYQRSIRYWRRFDQYRPTRISSQPITTWYEFRPIRRSHLGHSLIHSCVTPTWVRTQVESTHVTVYGNVRVPELTNAIIRDLPRLRDTEAISRDNHMYYNNSLKLAHALGARWLYTSTPTYISEIGHHD